MVTKIPIDMPAMHAQIIMAARLLRRCDGVHSVAGTVCAEDILGDMGHEILIRSRMVSLSAVGRNDPYSSGKIKKSEKFHDAARPEGILFSRRKHGIKPGLRS